MRALLRTAENSGIERKLLPRLITQTCAVQSRVETIGQLLCNFWPLSVDAGCANQIICKCRLNALMLRARAKWRKFVLIEHTSKQMQAVVQPPPIAVLSFTFIQPIVPQPTLAGVALPSLSSLDRQELHQQHGTKLVYTYK